LYGAGPRTVPESNAKKAHEKLALDDLRRATKVVALTVLDLLAALRRHCPATPCIGIVSLDVAQEIGMTWVEEWVACHALMYNQTQ
jgi:hypothetical protein